MRRFTAISFAATSSSKRKLLFDPTPPGKRKRFSPLEDAQFFKIQPIPGCSPANSNVITFTYTTGKHPIRFLQEPICIKYTATAQRQGAAAPYDAGELYLDPALSVTAFIDECEIDLDNTNVFKDATERHALYQVLNRRFTTTEMRRAVGHTDPHLLHNEGQMAAGNFTYTKAINRMKFGTGHAQIMTGSLDGNPLLGAPKNLSVESLTNSTGAEHNRPAIIPPFTSINIRLRLRENLKQHILLCGSALKVGGNYWRVQADEDALEEGEATDWKAEKFPLGLTIKVKEICLLAERLFFTDEKALRTLKGDSLSYFFDFPTFFISSIPSGVSFYPLSFVIPPSTPLVYVVFMVKHQLAKDTVSSRPSDITKFVLPPNLSHIGFRLNDRSLLFEKGIEVSAGEPATSLEYKLYHNYLVEENLTDIPFDQFCPPVLRGYDNVFVLNLCDAAFAHSATLTVTPTFSTGAPSDWYCVMVLPTEKKFKKTKAGWETNLTT